MRSGCTSEPVYELDGVFFLCSSRSRARTSTHPGVIRNFRTGPPLSPAHHRVFASARHPPSPRCASLRPFSSPITSHTHTQTDPHTRTHTHSHHLSTFRPYHHHPSHFIQSFQTTYTCNVPSHIPPTFFSLKQKKNHTNNLHQNV